MSSSSLIVYRISYYNKSRAKSPLRSHSTAAAAVCSYLLSQKINQIRAKKLTDRASTIPSKIRDSLSDTHTRDLLDREISKEHLQSSNERKNI